MNETGIFSVFLFLVSVVVAIILWLLNKIRKGD
jgi:hypothetical protein